MNTLSEPRPVPGAVQRAPEIELHRWKFYLSPAKSWEAMYDACRTATQSIDFEQYILSIDEVGTRFLEILRRRAAEGLRVRILCDMYGSRSFYWSVWPEKLRRAGVEVRFFNPITVRRLHRIYLWTHRDHRKIQIVDSQRAYIGGVCFDRQMRDWRDTHVRIEGPVVKDIARSFVNLWTNSLPERIPAQFPTSRNGRLFRLVSNAPGRKRNYIYQSFLEQVRNARVRVLLATPYFIPNRRFFRELRHAVRRGVEVHLLVPDQSDRPFVDAVARSHYAVALRAGIRVHLHGSEMMHAKVMIVDDCWASIGSSNLDYRSFFTNYEGNLFVTDPGFVSEVKGQFERDLGESTEITSDTWRMSFVPQRAAGYVGRLVKKFL